ncbi:MAG: hypothetical protein OEX19_07965, partial [Gammaproteobacteria bacterium]|nr:hypothetical protein [Gammaproteobacteria bacterium]
MLHKIYHWFDRTVLELGREFQWTYLPPLMVYLAAGISGLTGIVGTFFVKDHLGLSAEFLAALGFWAGIPWALKMPLGHLVDLIWRYKFILVYIGAGLIGTSLLIMIGLLAHTDFMASIMSVNAWFVISTLLAPIGYVVQDVVADAMTVEAVPNIDNQGRPIDPATKRLMHTTMQTLGRVAIIGGSIFVAMLNVYMFNGADGMAEAEKVATYVGIYEMALLIPIISVTGVLFGGYLKLKKYRTLRGNGVSHVDAWGVI